MKFIVSLVPSSVVWMNGMNSVSAKFCSSLAVFGLVAVSARVQKRSRAFPGLAGLAWIISKMADFWFSKSASSVLNS